MAAVHDAVAGLRAAGNHVLQVLPDVCPGRAPQAPHHQHAAGVAQL